MLKKKHYLSIQYNKKTNLFADMIKAYIVIQKFSHQTSFSFEAPVNADKNIDNAKKSVIQTGLH